MTPQEEYVRRRKERQRRIRRRRRFIAMVVLIFAALVICGILCFTTFFPIRTVTVQGDTRYTEKEIVAACHISKKDQVLSVSANVLTKRIREKLPYVETVKIKRRLPNAVTLTVYDAAVFGAYRLDGENSAQYAIVNQNHRILEITDALPEITVIVCKNAVSNGTEMSFNDETSADLVERLSLGLSNAKITANEINVNSTIALQATVEGRFIVNFGTATDLKKKINHLNGMLQNMDASLTGRIDLSMWTPQKPKGTFVQESIETGIPKAAFESNGNYYTVTENNRVIQVLKTVPENLPVIRCDTAGCAIGKIVTFSSKVTQQTVEKMRNLLDTNKLPWTVLDIQDPDAVQVEIGGRFTVLWGNQVSAEEKAKFIAKQIAQLNENVSGTFDLTDFANTSPEEMFTEK